MAHVVRVGDTIIIEVQQRDLRTDDVGIISIRPFALCRFQGVHFR
ncbi:39444_t:CDS:1, partial [Gigaspora margarita]